MGASMPICGERYNLPSNRPRTTQPRATQERRFSDGISFKAGASPPLISSVDVHCWPEAELVISALFFGAAHLANPAATLWSSAAIAISAGMLLALVYAITRSLWACIGLHAAWNIMQGTVYGIPVSGTKANGWLVSYRTGPDWLSGGAFGAETSVVALALGLMLSLILLVIALRHHSLVPPAWRRSR
jgi:hypothetical protein